MTDWSGRSQAARLLLLAKRLLVMIPEQMRSCPLVMVIIVMPMQSLSAVRRLPIRPTLCCMRLCCCCLWMALCSDST